jgi:surface carbohydrate biosynthesis protein
MYEIENRELQSRIYIATKLLKEGFEVSIFQHSALWMIALFSKPGFVCLKSTPYQFDLVIELLAKRGFRIIAWQEEGLHHIHGQKQSPVFSRNSAGLIDHYFAWHQADADLAIRTGVLSSKIEIVGNARIEVLLNSSPSPNVGLSLKNRILVLTNFDKSFLAYDFSNDSNLDEEGKKLADSQWSAEKSSALSNQLLYEELFNRLGAEEKLNSRVRPYFYEKNLAFLKYGLVSDAHFSISESLHNCDVLIHYGSTGGIEATVLGIPNLILAASTDGIDQRLIKSGNFFSSVDYLLDEIFSIVNSASHAENLKVAQHKSQVEVYEFDLRESSHADRLIAFVKMTNLQTAKSRIGITRIRVALHWTFVEIKTSLRKRLTSARIVKANRINHLNLSEKLWDPVRNEFQEELIKYFGRAICFKNWK